MKTPLRAAMSMVLLVGTAVWIPSPARGFGPRPVGVWLGLHAVETTAQLRTALGVDAPDGALVMDVAPKSPADKAGLRAGDVMTRVDGKPVGDAGEILNAVGDRKPGDTVQVEFVRDRTPRTAAVVLGKPRDRRMRVGRWSFPVPGFDVPPDVERQLRGFQDRVERQLRDLEKRLHQLEDDHEPARTVLPG